MHPAVPSPGEHPTCEGRGTEADSDRLFGFGSARDDIARRSDRHGRCIRHAPLRAALPVFPLTVAMIETALGAVLMATVGAAPLFAKRWEATLWAAITLTTITRAADDENRVACAASSQPKNNFAPIRHPGRQVGLDKDDRSWQGKTISAESDGYLLRGCQGWDLAVWRGGIPESFFHLSKQLTSQRQVVGID